ncbi:MAG: hypothetical protein V4737_16670, partial [Curtobacterium sp.]
MGLNDDTNRAVQDSGVTGGPDGPDSGLPTPGDQPGPLGGGDIAGGLDGQGGGEPGSTSAPV